MRRVFLFTALSLSLSSPFAFASDPEPKPTAVVAELVRGGGLSPIDAPTQAGIRVLRNGRVVYFEDFASRPSTTRKLALLSRDVLMGLLDRIANAKAAPLADIRPEDPECMDAPSSAFRIYPAAQTEITLAQEMNCKLYLPSDYSEENRKSGIVDTLKALETLGRLTGL